MVYRIDYQHFLTHMIDHFLPEEITHFQYAIISAKILNNNKVSNVGKISELYPDPETVLTYSEYHDKEVLEKMYMDLLLPNKREGDKKEWMSNLIYKVFINTLIHHHDVVIICDRSENDYIDILCKCLKNNFAIEVCDLNELFSKGRVGPIYIDRDEIWNKAVDIRRASMKEQFRALESSRDGKLKLIGLMGKKEKLKKLKELGIKATKSDKEYLDKLLIEEWVDNDEDE